MDRLGAGERKRISNGGKTDHRPTTNDHTEGNHHTESRKEHQLFSIAYRICDHLVSAKNVTFSPRRVLNPS